MIRRRLHCLGHGAPRANPFGEDRLYFILFYSFLCSVSNQSPTSNIMVAVNEHLQHSPRDTRLCRLMVMAIAQRKGHVWEAQSVAVCQIIVA